VYRIVELSFLVVLIVIFVGVPEYDGVSCLEHPRQNRAKTVNESSSDVMDVCSVFLMTFSPKHVLLFSTLEI
jgi:hypothetical protein